MEEPFSGGSSLRPGLRPGVGAVRAELWGVNRPETRAGPGVGADREGLPSSWLDLTSGIASPSGSSRPDSRVADRSSGVGASSARASGRTSHSPAFFALLPTRSRRVRRIRRLGRGTEGR